MVKTIENTDTFDSIATPDIFLSTFQRSLGSKYRIALPAEFRSVLMHVKSNARIANTFVAFRSYVYDAVECFSVDRMKQLSKQMDSLDPFGTERDDFALSVFADAVSINFDTDDGRMTLPESLAIHAGIKPGEDLVFVGKGATFQIWNVEKFKTHQEQARAALFKRRV